MNIKCDEFLLIAFVVYTALYKGLLINITASESEK